jgi:hypothetical protein
MVSGASEEIQTQNPFTSEEENLLIMQLNDESCLNVL